MTEGGIGRAWRNGGVSSSSPNPFRHDPHQAHPIAVRWQVDEHGRTALWAACRGGSAECVKVIMDTGGDPDNMDDRKGSFEVRRSPFPSSELGFKKLRVHWDYPTGPAHASTDRQLVETRLI